MITKFLAATAGATAIEYGLIAALIAVAILSGLGAFSDALLAWYENISEGLEGA